MLQILAATLFLLTFSPTVWADPNASMAPACPSGNLIARKAPTQWQEIRRELSLITDETLAPEGAVWDAGLAVILDTGASVLTWDLGSPTMVRGLAIQADANDTYTIWGSMDGTQWKAVGQIDPVSGHGLRMRTIQLGSPTMRFLRVGEGQGDGFYSISEVAAYCQLPTPFPAPMKVGDAPVAPPGPKTYLDYWNNDTSARIEMVLAFLAALLLWYERRLVGAGFEALRRRARNLLIGTMGIFGFLLFFNFGFWHFPSFIHGWDTFHYYIGSKYFKELHYERLYECVAIADSEEPGLRRRVELRKIRNLHTNNVETTAHILAHPERCKQHFTAERWQSFRHDLRYFRSLENPRRWDDSQTDHGFNGTPVWNILGTVLSNLAPANKFNVYMLDAIDPILITILAGLIWSTFGYRTASVALIVFATNFPSRWYWIGGSYLRWDWLFMMGLSLVLLKKQKPLWAGAAIGYAAQLRIFPGFMLGLPFLIGGYQLIRTRTVEQWIRKLFLGAALSGVVLVPLSFVTTGGPTVYAEFFRNTVKHTETPLTNNMGLRTVLNFRPAETGNRMSVSGPGVDDSWIRWKQARLRAFREALPLYVTTVIGFLVLLGYASKGLPPWAIVALSSTLITFGAELTCYYYAFLLLPALLYAIVPRAGEWLLILTGVTQFIGWAPIKGVPAWIKNLLPPAARESPFVRNFGMPSGLDEQYTWMSLFTIIVFVLIAYELAVKRRTAQAALGDSIPEELAKEKADDDLAAPQTAARVPALARVASQDKETSSPRKRKRKHK